MIVNNLGYISSALVIFNGIICLMYGEKLLPLLPIISGGILLIKGVIKLAEGIANKDYASLERTDMEKSFIYIAIGLGVLFKKEDALFIVGMFWGLHGLTKSVNYLNVALYNFNNKEKWILLLIKAIAEFALSALLIFDPFGHLGHHIIILGLELVLDGSIDIINEHQDRKKLKQEQA